MKSRKASDLRSLSTQEIEGFLKESEESIVRLRFQAALGQLDDTSTVKTMRKDIARMKTILTERKKLSN
ncbi:MAG: 50S ribosomal protein L29 [Chlorobi bacterium]|nr:MAG: 50S ribosomal protein L29 [Bacteroidota bacterium]KXK36079.1 MAG: 50S ribosomal protein L29 [Chlorobi bacterium OLB6]MBE2266408.1 50S ribosomal protein L29 [Flavobacteriales bacterium]MBL1160342.1 50S ribosomal protein L29 [Chlorobiota bacterium]MBW7854387.1 50S ribosomal protein L29 [Candidatus Kapabacteria bacterium]MCC6331729.1 50S ribosomal protein L29 [Ignavibacteria bacterium]